MAKLPPFDAVHTPTYSPIIVERETNQTALEYGLSGLNVDPTARVVIGKYKVSGETRAFAINNLIFHPDYRPVW